MKTKQVIAPLLSLSVGLFLSSCGDDHQHPGHHHKAPHGGALVELGEAPLSFFQFTVPGMVLVATSNRNGASFLPGAAIAIGLVP